MSTSGRMIAGSLPPSSSVTRLTSLADAAMMALPVLTEPVKETLRMDGELTRCTPTLWPSWSLPETKLKTPLGKTSARSSATRWPVSGVYGEGLCTMVFPQVMEGAHFCTAVNIGNCGNTARTQGTRPVRMELLAQPAARTSSSAGSACASCTVGTHVPRRDACDRADRLADGDGLEVLIFGVDLDRQLRVDGLLHVLPAHAALADRHGERLALLLHEQFRKLSLVRLQDVERLGHQGAALLDRRGAPLRERRLGGLDGVVAHGRVRVRGDRENLARGRVDDREPAASGCIPQVLKLKLSVLTLSQRLVTPRTPRISGARLGVQPLQLPEIPIHYKWGPQ